MKVYRGIRTPQGASVTVNGIKLAQRNDLRNHSPDGFEWGYSGSGPAQLALAILADHLHDDERAVEYYQEFKRTVIEGLKFDWEITDAEIDDILSTIQNNTSGPLAIHSYVKTHRSPAIKPLVVNQCLKDLDEVGSDDKS